MLSISAETFDEAWYEALSKVMARGDRVGTRIGLSLEARPALLVIRNSRQRFIFSRTYNLAFAYAEFFWIMRGDNSLRFVEFWNGRMRNYSDDGLTLSGAYGQRLRQAYGFDQFKAAYEELQRDPLSRQVVLQIWHPERDFPRLGPASKDVACSLSDGLLIRDRKLEWFHSMRSNDLIWGMPYDVLVFSCIQEVLAGWLGVETGPYSHMVDVIQVYQNHWEYADSLLQKTTPPTPNRDTLDDLRMGFAEFGALLEEIWALLNAMMALEESDQILALWSTQSFPAPYRNILIVMLSELLARKGGSKRGLEMLAECTNAAQRSIMSRWIDFKYGE